LPYIRSVTIIVLLGLEKRKKITSISHLVQGKLWFKRTFGESHIEEKLCHIDMGNGTGQSQQRVKCVWEIYKNNQHRALKDIVFGTYSLCGF
jgi:hypothetical protein